MQILRLQYPLPSSVQPPLLTLQAEWPVSGMHMYILCFMCYIIFYFTCYIIIYVLCISSSISEVGFSTDVNVVYKLLASQCERGTATEMFYS